MHSDHRQPGSNTNRPTVVAPIRTMSTFVLSGVRVSSGDSKSRDCTPAMAASCGRSTKTSSRLGASRYRAVLPLAAGALAVHAAGPATGPALAFLQLLLGPPNAAFS